MKLPILFFSLLSLWWVLTKTVHGLSDFTRDGDLIVAALLPISKGYLCQGEDASGILQAEALLHAISQQDSSARTNLTIGYKITDTCGNPRVAVKAAFDLVATLRSLANSSRSQTRRKIVAVLVDGSNSTIYEAVSGILDANDLPQIVTGKHGFNEAVVRKEIGRVSSDLLQELGYSWVNIFGSDVIGSPAWLLRSKLRRQKGSCLVESERAENPGQRLRRAKIAIVLSTVEKAVEVIHQASHHGKQNKSWIIITDPKNFHFRIEKASKSESIFILSKDIPKVIPRLKKFLQHVKKLEAQEFRNRPWVIRPKTRRLLSDWLDWYINDRPHKSHASSKSLVILNRVTEILTMVSSVREFLCARVPCCKASVYVTTKRMKYLRSQLKSHLTKDWNYEDLCHSIRSRANFQLKGARYVLKKAYWNTSIKAWTLPEVGEWRNNSGWNISPSEIRVLKSSKKAWKCLRGYPVTLPHYWGGCVREACLVCPTNDQARTESQTNASSCQLCTSEKCSAIPLAYTRLTHPFALTITTLCVLGEVLVILVVIIFAKFRKTPVVKSSNRAFNFFMLSTLGFWFAVIPTFIGRPNHLRCNALVATFLTLYATVSAILLSKTVRLLLIFKSMKQGTKWLGNVFFFLSTIAFIVVQTLLCGLNYVFYPLDVDTLFRYDVVLLHCGRSSSPVTALGFAYNCLLSGLCGFFAYKVRKLPQNFNEAKYISLAIFSGCMSWLIVLAGYYDENCSALQVTLVALGLTIGAFSVLACLFFPKVHTILFHPQLNTKSATIEGARRYSVEVAVSFGGIRSSRPRSSTLDLQYPSRSHTDLTYSRDNQLGVPLGRSRTVSDCSYSHLVAPRRCRHCSACSTDTGSSDSPRSGTISVPVSGATSPI